MEKQKAIINYLKTIENCVIYAFRHYMRISSQTGLLRTLQNFRKKLKYDAEKSCSIKMHPMIGYVLANFIFIQTSRRVKVHNCMHQDFYTFFLISWIASINSFAKRMHCYIVITKLCNMRCTQIRKNNFLTSKWQHDLG